MATSSPYSQLLEKRGPGKGPSLWCLANQKGGVGKTTVAVNAGAALAQRGRRVLVVDLDPQANATTGLGLDHRTQERSTYDVLMGTESLASVVRPTALENLFCVPGSVDLAGAEVELAGADEREFRLAKALDPRPDFDVVIVDCPPSLGLLTLNALTAVPDLLAPVQCEYYALEGLGQLLATAERVRRGLNPALRLSGLVLTMYDARTRLSSQVAEEIRGHFGDAVFRTVVPRSVRLSEAPSYGEPVVTLDKGSRGAIAFRLLAAELEERFFTSASGPAGAQERAQAARPGPGGRGYGVPTAEPRGLDRSWPRPPPWDDARTKRTIDLNEEEPMTSEWVRD